MAKYVIFACLGLLLEGGVPEVGQGWLLSPASVHCHPLTRTGPEWGRQRMNRARPSVLTRLPRALSQGSVSARSCAVSGLAVQPIAKGSLGPSVSSLEQCRLF